MIAKYAGTCRRCHQRIEVGDPIDFVKGTGAFHPAGTCEEAPPPPPDPKLKAAVEWLAGKVESGQADGFLVGLHLQFATKGWLSPKQLGCVERAMQKENPGAGPPLVPDGRYAVLLPTTEQYDGGWFLFRVWRGTQNPNVQRVFMVQGTEKGQRVLGQLEVDALEAIAKDPIQAAIEFGHRTDHCSKCGIELRKNLSRFIGVGPVCLKHWLSDEDRLERLEHGRWMLREVEIDPEGDYDDLTPAFDYERDLNEANEGVIA